MLNIVGHYLMLGFLLALIPWFLARIVSRRFGVAAAWIEIALVVAFGWWWLGLFPSSCKTPPECAMVLYAKTEPMIAIPCLLLPFLLLIGQMDRRNTW